MSGHAVDDGTQICFEALQRALCGTRQRQRQQRHHAVGFDLV